MTAPATPSNAGSPNVGEGVRWRERWYGSEPQKGSAIVDEHGNLIAYLGGNEDTHWVTTAIVAAHNAALATTPTVPAIPVERESDEAVVDRCAKAMWQCDEHTYSDRVWSDIPEYAQDLWRDRARACLITASPAYTPRSVEGEALAFGRAYFERGFIACYAWTATKRDADPISDAVIDRAWDHRDEGMDGDDLLPIALAASPAYTPRPVTRTDEEEAAKPRCGCDPAVARRVIIDHGTCGMGGCPYGGDF